MNDLGVILILFFKDEMIEKGIIPKNVKWDCLSEEEKNNVIKFIRGKIDEQKGKMENAKRNSN